jgi:hypothetical protein
VAQSTTDHTADGAPTAKSEDVDPWDEPGPTGSDASRSEPTGTQNSTDPPADATPPAAATDDVDPWDEPAPTDPEASPREPTAAQDSTDGGPSDAQGSTDGQPTDAQAPADRSADAAPPAAVDDVDPWDEPAAPTGVAPASAEPDPWDEPVAPVPVSRASSPEPAGPVKDTESEGEPEQPSSPASQHVTGDAALLDEPDPWD